MKQNSKLGVDSSFLPLETFEVFKFTPLPLDPKSNAGSGKHDQNEEKTAILGPLQLMANIEFDYHTGDDNEKRLSFDFGSSLFKEIF